MKQANVARIVGAVTFLTATIGFSMIASLADAIGGDGGTTNALLLGLFIATWAMEKVDPTGEGQ